MPQKFTLDFSIYSSSDRLKSIESIPLETLSPLELETITNYILYGKDSDGTSCVDRKEVQIKTKFNSYNKEKTISLDELMESPTFDENLLQKNRTVYKKGKISIDREKVKDIPGIQDLWKEIDRVQKLLDQHQGKRPKDQDFKELSQKEVYYYTHYLIQLRTQQYYLIDGYYPTIQLQKNHSEFHCDPIDYQVNYPVLPRGLFREEVDKSFEQPRAHRQDQSFTEVYSEEEVERLEKEKKYYFDFRNQDHLYYLIQFYQEIEMATEKQPASPLRLMLRTLDFYIDKANLSEQQRLIINDKKVRMPNKEIVEHLREELGISHQENYISTIWNKAIGLIIEAVELNYDEWLCRNYDKAWKVCNKCGRELLRDSRNFVRKAKAPDGLTSRCKKCDKELRKNYYRRENRDGQKTNN